MYYVQSTLYIVHSTKRLLQLFLSHTERNSETVQSLTIVTSKNKQILCTQYSILLTMASDNNYSTLTTLIIGIAAGAVLGILFAPDKGSNTRARLKFKLARYKEQLKDILEEIETSKDAIVDSETFSDTKETAEELVSEIESLIKKIQSGKA